MLYKYVSLLVYRYMNTFDISDELRLISLANIQHNIKSIFFGFNGNKKRKEDAIHIS